MRYADLTWLLIQLGKREEFITKSKNLFMWPMSFSAKNHATNQPIAKAQVQTYGYLFLPQTNNKIFTKEKYLEFSIVYIF